MERDISGELSIVVSSTGTVYSVPVLTAVVSVGRSKAADIRLPDRVASARHAVLRFEKGIATVEDVGSRNGVRVQDVLIEVGKPTRLRLGDVIQIGASALSVVPSGLRMLPPPPPRGGAAPACQPAAPTER